MEKRRLGKTDMLVAPLGFGGAETGYGPIVQNEFDRLLNTALDSGCNVIDTAECYGDGEEKIGQAVSHRRGDYYLFTKCGHSSGFELPDWDPKMLAMSIDRSLQRLRTDALDLIQLHSCDEELLRHGEVVEVLQQAREAGKTRYIGYSGDRNSALYAVESGFFDTLQISVNIADQEPLDLTLSTAKERKMGVIAKRPVANVAWTKEPQPDSYSRVYWERLQELGYSFLKAPVDDAAGYALRFTLALDVHVAIVGTSNPDRYRRNLRYVEMGPLPSEDVGRIRSRWKEVAQPDWVGQG